MYAYARLQCAYFVQADARLSTLISDETERISCLSEMNGDSRAQNLDHADLTIIDPVNNEFHGI